MAVYFIQPESLGPPHGRRGMLRVCHIVCRDMADGVPQEGPDAGDLSGLQGSLVKLGFTYWQDLFDDPAKTLNLIAKL